eukprot:scaffold393_cov279-Pinguiococcus_pyrenoidosus.AAC.3
MTCAPRIISSPSSCVSTRGVVDAVTFTSSWQRRWTMMFRVVTTGGDIGSSIETMRPPFGLRPLRLVALFIREAFRILCMG